MSTPVRYAAELYHVQLSSNSFSIQDQQFELCRGLASTVNAVLRRDRADLVRAARALGGTGRDAANVVARYAQVQWYRAKGAEPPPAVVTRFNDILTGDTEMPEPQPTETPAVAPKAARGTRPYCRQLIAEGVTDEKELLAKVKAAFPDKPFAIGDVRGQLRVAGKLQWTKRKKQG